MGFAERLTGRSANKQETDGQIICVGKKNSQRSKQASVSKSQMNTNHYSNQLFLLAGCRRDSSFAPKMGKSSKKAGASYAH